MKKNILVTGGAGFIGSNFVRYLLEREPDVKITNLDLLTYAGSLENLGDLPQADRHRFVRGDICDQELVASLLAEDEIQVLVHFAAETHVDRSILGPGEFVRTNIQGTFTLLEALREHQSNTGREIHFHHISTDEVYGSLQKGEPSFTENSRLAPNSPYAASKAASDHLVRSYFHTYDLPVTITNCSNNYGPYQFPEKLIPLMIINAWEGKPLPIYGDGQQIRDWLYVGDHCQAIWLVIQGGTPGETYNIGGGNQPTNLEIVHQLCTVMDELVPDSKHVPHEALVEHVQDRPGHDRRYAVDFNKITEELGWKPETTLADGLKETVAWYLGHKDWLEKVNQREDFKTWVETNYHQREEK
ncbi:MAG: dTDP-glucose 4,6-dehydratase [Anaerolineales bacterium]